MNQYNKIMAKLQDRRKSFGASQAELADLSGVSKRMIQDYEHEDRDINGAKFLTLLKLCNTMGCRLEDILDDPETLSELKTYTDAGVAW